MGTSAPRLPSQQQVRGAVVPTTSLESPQAAAWSAVDVQPVRPSPSLRVIASRLPDCQAGAGLLCAGLRTQSTPRRTAAQATLCPSSVSARASYTVPDVQEAGRTVVLSTRSCSS